MARLLVAAGVVLIVAGLAWPLLARLGLGNLPGDIHIERENFTVFIPLTSGLIVSALISVVVSVVFWLLRK
jgi:hypothetical protein